MFITRFLLVLMVALGLGFAALLALGNLVEPEQRDVQVSIPLPKPNKG